MCGTELSVVVPVYGCVECLEALHARLVAVLDGITPDYEIVYVDDRSRDGAWEQLAELAGIDARVVAIRLSRNFGQHPAITAGLEHARGRWTVVMDCDLQDPPEEIPRLYEKASAGYDIVYARRSSRRHSLFRRAASATYFAILNRLAGTAFDSGFGNFSIISEHVRAEVLRFRDKDRHYLMILTWLGFSSATIDFSHADRFAGKSAYSFRRLVNFAFEGLFFQTTTLLRWIVYAGFVVSLLGAGLAAFYVANYFLGSPYPGWTTLGVLVLLTGGFIITSTGVTGLYIGKIFMQVKDRPLFVVDTVVQTDPRVKTDPRHAVWAEDPGARDEAPHEQRTF